MQQGLLCVKRRRIAVMPALRVCSAGQERHEKNKKKIPAPFEDCFEEEIKLAVAFPHGGNARKNMREERDAEEDSGG